MTAKPAPRSPVRGPAHSVVREALYQAAVSLADAKGGAAWREIAEAATVVEDGVEQRGVAYAEARVTIKNMVKAGDLFEVGREKPEGTSHWRALYAPALEEYGYAGNVAYQALDAIAAVWRPEP